MRTPVQLHTCTVLRVVLLPQKYYLFIFAFFYETVARLRTSKLGVYCLHLRGLLARFPACRHAGISLYVRRSFLLLALQILLSLYISHNNAMYGCIAHAVSQRARPLG